MKDKLLMQGIAHNDQQWAAGLHWFRVQQEADIRGLHRLFDASVSDSSLELIEFIASSDQAANIVKNMVSLCLVELAVRSELQDQEPAPPDE